MSRKNPDTVRTYRTHSPMETYVHSPMETYVASLAIGVIR